MTQIQANTLFKRSLESFMNKLGDEKLADMHYAHHNKRRIKNLLRLNETIL